MTKQETYDYLRARGVAFEITEHPAVFNMEECAAVDMPYPEDDAKNIFVRDAKKQNYYLITVRHDKRVDLKEFQRRHGTTRAQLRLPGGPDGPVTPGSVTPLGLLNDPDRSVQFYLDRDFEGGRIGVHPNDNTATVWLSTRDLLDLLREHGSPVQWAEI